jgi:hypothetical protein
MAVQVTLGGFTPLSSVMVIPSLDQSWWKPCLTRAEDSTDTHVWFLAKVRGGSLYCEACRWNRPRVVIGPKGWIADINDALEQGDMRRVRELLTSGAVPAAVVERWKAKSRVDWTEYYKERAAVFEFLGGLQRPEAEAAALELAGECPA